MVCIFFFLVFVILMLFLWCILRRRFLQNRDTELLKHEYFLSSLFILFLRIKFLLTKTGIFSAIKIVRVKDNDRHRKGSEFFTYKNVCFVMILYNGNANFTEKETCFLCVWHKFEKTHKKHVSLDFQILVRFSKFDVNLKVK